MDIQLRIILLVVGLLILFGVAIDIFRRRPAKQTAIDNFDTVDIETRPESSDRYIERSEPELESELDFVPDFIPELDLDIDLDLIPDEPPPEPITNVIAIYIMARSPHGFSGAELSNALRNAHLHFKNKMFYRYEQDDGTGESWFSLAKAVEPGYFNIETLPYEKVPGITLIMLPNKVTRPVLALDKLIRTAKQIAFVLNGELLDDKRQALTLSTIENYKVQIYSD